MSLLTQEQADEKFETRMPNERAGGAHSMSIASSAGKVLVISSAFPPMRAPESAHTYELCNRLRAAGADVELLTMQSSDAAAFPVHGVMNGWRWRDLPRLIMAIRRIKPDVVLLIYLGVMYDHRPMITFWPTFMRLLCPRTRVVIQFENAHGTDIAGIPRFLRAAMRLVAGWKGVSSQFGTLMRDSDRVIALAEAHAARLEEFYQPLRGKARVIPAPPIAAKAFTVSRQDARRSFSCGPDDLVIAYFGFIYRNKGVDCLIRAFSQIESKHPHAKLVIIGGPLQYKNDAADSQQYWQELHDLTAKLGIGNRVHFTGYVEDVPMTGADVAVLPMADGLKLNNSSYAAVASLGLPVVATRGPGTDCLFEHGKTVLLFDPGDDAALANNLERLITEPQLRTSLAQSSSRIAEDVLSWNAAIRSTLEVLS